MLRISIALFWLVSVGLLAGCVGTSPPARYYLMHPMTVDASVQTPAEYETALALGIGPVTWPDYLARQQIVTRNSANAVRLAEFDRWAEPLKQNFTRVLKENLAILLGTNHVLIEPWPKSMEVEYRLAVEVIRFDVDQANTATLDVRWVLMRESDEVLLRIHKSTHTAQADGSDYETVVAALNQVLADFSREAAGQIQAIYLKDHGR